MTRLTENFSLEEFACKDGTAVPEELIPSITLLAENLQVLRDKLQCPIHINSGYRTPEYNKRIGGVTNSMHVKGKAADITARNFSPDQIAKVIEVLIASGKMKEGGLGRYPGFTHYDVRDNRSRWIG